MITSKNWCKERRGALGLHMIKIPWNSGNDSRSWHCALVVVRTAATAITHAEYVKQAWLQGEEGFPRPASPTCCFTRLLRGLAGGTVARGTAARGTTARRTALRRVVALAGKFRGCWASQRGLSKRLEANTTTLLTNRQKWLNFRLQLTKSFYLLSDVICHCHSNIKYFLTFEHFLSQKVSNRTNKSNCEDLLVHNSNIHVITYDKIMSKSIDTCRLVVFVWFEKKM